MLPVIDWSPYIHILLPLFTVWSTGLNFPPILDIVDDHTTSQNDTIDESDLKVKVTMETYGESSPS